jgi:hypothetical protein
MSLNAIKKANVGLDALNQDEISLVGRAVKLMATGDIVEEFEFGARMAVELPAFREMALKWPDWDDTNDKSPECLAINNTLNDLLHGSGLSEPQCKEMLGVGRQELLRVYRKWAASRGWNATGVR